MPINMVGERYGRLVITHLISRSKSGHSIWGCICDCGKSTKSRRNSLISKRQISCGCYNKEIISTHGAYKTRLYKIHTSMKQRCTLPSAGAYKNYGAKGITYCKEWANYEAFAKWAHANGYTNKLTIDRIDGRLGYGPSNCRWVSYSVQGRNRPKKPGTSSEYIGVSFRKNRKTKCWLASIRISGFYKTKSFTDEIEAAKWRDKICKDNKLIGTIYNF